MWGEVKKEMDRYDTCVGTPATQVVCHLHQELGGRDEKEDYLTCCKSTTEHTKFRDKLN